MPNVTVDLLPTSRPCDVAIVIDVLRMTTTACHLFSRGLHELAVVADVKAARTRASRDEALLLGERHGVKLPGFDGGNSPLEYERFELSDRRAVLCTSNGSFAVEAMHEAEHLLLGAIVNARAVAQRALELAASGVTLVCAGTEGEISLDDAFGAGCITREIVRFNPEVALSDSAKLGLQLYRNAAAPAQLLRESRHGAQLERLGFARDIDFAAHADRYDIVPVRTARAPARFKLA